MNTFSDALQHLTNDPELSFHVAPSASAFGGWYAAFRNPGWEANELQPERGWGYGSTPEGAIDAAVTSFRANEDERAA